jgi:hypothetical protein
VPVCCILAGMGFFAGHRSIFRTPPVALALASAALGGLVASGCGFDLQNVFTDTGGGQTTLTSSGGSGALGGGGAGGGNGGFVSTMTTTTGTGGDPTTTSTGSATSTTTSTGAGSDCGNGTCEPGENNGNCSEDCPPGTCVHSVCEPSQDPLQDGCTGPEADCVAAVCAQNGGCCNNEWNGECVGLANQLCNNLCCGDGACTGEQCDVCLSDCGSCPPAPTCPHTLCYGAANAEPLNTMDCYEPCVDELCAVIDMDSDNCCEPFVPVWSAECTTKVKGLCPGYTCIDEVCAAMPSCCTTNWTTACVDLVKTTASCGTTCDCAHSPCQEGDALVKGCNPCVDAVCAADEYCCDNSWDGYCVGEVGTMCGVDCN